MQISTMLVCLGSLPLFLSKVTRSSIAATMADSSAASKIAPPNRTEAYSSLLGDGS